MAVVEMSLKVNNSEGYQGDKKRKSRDGAIISIQSDGHLLTAADCATTLAGGGLPSNWGDLTVTKQETIQRRFDEVIWMTEPGRTPQEVADVKVPNWQTLPPAKRTIVLARMQQLIGKNEGEALQMSTYGIDTLWGWKVQRRQCVVLITIANDRVLQLVEDLVTPPLDPASHPAGERLTLRKRRWRIKYEDIFDAATLADLRDPTIHVPVDRTMTPVQLNTVRQPIN